MIRRLLVVAAIAVGVITVGAGPAAADPGDVRVSNGNIACVYNVKPLNIGLCIGV